MWPESAADGLHNRLNPKITLGSPVGGGAFPGWRLGVSLSHVWIRHRRETVPDSGDGRGASGPVPGGNLPVRRKGRSASESYRERCPIDASGHGRGDPIQAGTKPASKQEARLGAASRSAGKAEPATNTADRDGGPQTRAKTASSGEAAKGEAETSAVKAPTRGGLTGRSTIVNLRIPGSGQGQATRVP